MYIIPGRSYYLWSPVIVFYSFFHLACLLYNVIVGNAVVGNQGVFRVEAVHRRSRVTMTSAILFDLVLVVVVFSAGPHGLRSAWCSRRSNI